VAEKKHGKAAKASWIKERCMHPGWQGPDKRKEAVTAGPTASLRNLPRFAERGKGSKTTPIHERDLSRTSGVRRVSWIGDEKGLRKACHKRKSTKIFAFSEEELG